MSKKDQPQAPPVKDLPADSFEYLGQCPVCGESRRCSMMKRDGPRSHSRAFRTPGAGFSDRPFPPGHRGHVPAVAALAPADRAARSAAGRSARI